ncbi:hypothetical protein Tsp_05779, partial [Trichinella spiralis]
MLEIFSLSAFHNISVKEICIDCHDLETNATKEWHVQNIIPLLKVMYFKK